MNSNTWGFLWLQFFKGIVAYSFLRKVKVEKSWIQKVLLNHLTSWMKKIGVTKKYARFQRWFLGGYNFSVVRWMAQKSMRELSIVNAHRCSSNWKFGKFGEQHHHKIWYDVYCFMLLMEDTLSDTVTCDCFNMFQPSQLAWFLFSMNTSCKSSIAWRQFSTEAIGRWQSCCWGLFSSQKNSQERTALSPWERHKEPRHLKMQATSVQPWSFFFGKKNRGELCKNEFWAMRSIYFWAKN